MRTAIITGANAGIGYYTALALAGKNFRIVLACRSLARGDAAAAAIKAAHPSAVVQPMELDLTAFASVASFAERVHRDIGAVHVLCLNAGIGGMNKTEEPTADGKAHEIYRVNFVSHFLLTMLLEKALVAGAPARVVCLSSVTHRAGDASDWRAPLYSFSASRRTYATSKLAMAVLAAEITRRWGAHPQRVVAIAVNPGAVNSEIWYRGQLSAPLETYAIRPLLSSLFLTSEQGAACSVAAASEARFGDVAPGTYLCPYRTPASCAMPFELHGPFAGPRECTPHAAVADIDAGTALWEQTREALREWL